MRKTLAVIALALTVATPAIADVHERLPRHPPVREEPAFYLIDNPTGKVIRGPWTFGRCQFVLRQLRTNPNVQASCGYHPEFVGNDNPPDVEPMPPNA